MVKVKLIVCSQFSLTSCLLSSFKPFFSVSLLSLSFVRDHVLLKLSFSITKDARRAETVTERKSFCDDLTLFQHCSFSELPNYPVICQCSSKWFSTSCIFLERNFVMHASYFSHFQNNGKILPAYLDRIGLKNLKFA